MSHRRFPSLQRRTAWHPLFVRALRMILPRRYFHVDAEHPLSQEPLRLDAVVVRKRRLPPTFRPRALSALVDLLGERTLMEIKGATDRLDWTDLVRLLVYQGLYCIQERIHDPGRVRGLVVSPRLSASFVEQIRRRRGELIRLGPGTWEVRGLQHVTYVIETEAASDHVLHVFSRSFLRDPGAQVYLFTEEERIVVRELIHEIRQFSKEPQASLRYPDIEEVAMSMEEFFEAIAQEFSPEVRMKGLSAEARLKGISAEARLKGLPVAERLKGLSNDELEQLRALLDQQKVPPRRSRTTKSKGGRSR